MTGDLAGVTEDIAVEEALGQMDSHVRRQRRLRLRQGPDPRNDCAGAHRWVQQGREFRSRPRQRSSAHLRQPVPHGRGFHPGSVTTTNLALYGSSHGFDDDPSSPDYFRYSGTYRSFVSREAYRTIGNDLRWRYAMPFGSALLGLWAEEDRQTESRVAVDLTTGSLYDANEAAGSPLYYDFYAHLYTYQPYGELNWRVSDRWTMTFGMRWRDVTRDFDASAIQNFLPGTEGTVSRSVSSSLPSFDTNYRLAPQTSVYAQVARGSLDPSQACFYTAHPALGNQVEPENAPGEQLGIVQSTARYGISLDVYNIDFNNYVSTITAGGTRRT